MDWALEQAEPIRYQAKAGRKERDAGLEESRFYGDDELSGGGGHTHKYQSAYQAKKTARHNPHPTVKSIALARHLATLLLPPPEYAPRRILVPFAGSGSEMIGAMLAGWEEVVGIESDPEYCEIARARIAWWAKQPALLEVG